MVIALLLFIGFALVIWLGPLPPRMRIPAVEYDREKAYSLALMAEEAYRLGVPAGAVEVDNGTDRVLVLRGAEGTVYVVFRGTQPWGLRAWASNLKRSQKHMVHIGGYALIHGGFYGAVMALDTRIASAVREVCKRPAKVVVVGHSRGGAMAMIWAYLNRFHFPVSLVCTFGAPRVGNDVFRDEYNRALGAVTWKHCHNNDVVCRLPAWWRGGYRHPGRLVYLDRKGNVHVDALGRLYWDRLAGRVEALLRLELVDGIYDHAMGKYVRVLGRGKVDHVDRIDGGGAA